MGRYAKILRPQPSSTSADQLQKCGPIIELILHPPRASGSSLAVRGLGIFDTGAGRGAIDNSVVAQLALAPRGPKHASHGIGGRIESDVYDVFVDFPGPLGLGWTPTGRPGTNSGRRRSPSRPSCKGL